MNSQTFEQAIWIAASVPTVDHVITDEVTMHQWLNPALQCTPVGPWSSDIGAESLFSIRIPLITPTLKSKVIERSEGLIVWSFDGFFQGRDRWECIPQDHGTLLRNEFTFFAPSPLVNWGFQIFAASLTKRDMEDQLKRLKRIAETISLETR